MSDWKETLNKKAQTNTANPGGQMGVNQGFSTMDQGIGMPMFFASTPDGGETYEAVYKAAQELVERSAKQATSKGTFSVIRFTKDTYDIVFSSVLLVCKYDTPKGPKVVYQALMVEATGNDLPSYNDKNNPQYSVLVPNSEALNKIYFDLANKLVASVTRCEQVGTIEGVIIPRTLDADAEDAIRVLVATCFNSVFVEALEDAGVRSAVTIQEFARKPGSRFVVEQSNNAGSGVFHDATGLPIRTDICLRLCTRTGETKINQINGTSTSKDVVNVYGYVDFVYSPRQHNVGMMGMMNQGYNPAFYKQFAAKFVITHIQSPSSLLTTELVWLALVQATTLAKQKAWAKGFMYSSMNAAKGKNAQFDTNDICLLNVLANLGAQPVTGQMTGEQQFGKPLDKTVQGFGPNTIYNLIDTVCEDGLMISMDIPDAGLTTPVLSLFKYADSSDLARQRLFKALSDLSGSVFVDNAEPLFVGSGNRIHGGFYTDKNVLTDVRKVTSLLGMLANVTNTNSSPALVVRYEATMQNANVPVNLRCSERYNIFTPFTPGLHVNQWITRVDLNPELLIRVANHLANAGFRPQRDDNVNNVNMFELQNTNLNTGLIGSNFDITASTDPFGKYGNVNNYNTYYSRY